MGNFRRRVLGAGTAGADLQSEPLFDMRGIDYKSAPAKKMQ